MSPWVECIHLFCHIFFNLQSLQYEDGVEKLKSENSQLSEQRQIMSDQLQQLEDDITQLHLDFTISQEKHRTCQQEVRKDQKGRGYKKFNRAKGWTVYTFLILSLKADTKLGLGIIGRNPVSCLMML